MLEEALRYPTTGEKALERLLVGGVLVILSVLVLPAFLVYGYLVRCLAAVAAGEEAPPAFDDWESLFVDGVKAFAIAAVYAIVPVLLFLAFLVPVSVGTTAGDGGTAGILAGIGAVAFLLAIVLALGVAYLIMAALTTFAVEGRASAAFDLRAVGGFATSEPYVIAIVLALAVQVLVSLVVLVSTVFTFGLALLVLIPLGPFVNFWVYVVTAYLFGDAYREANDEESGGAVAGAAA